MELKELQKQFKSHIFSRDSEIAQHIVSDKLSSEFRLSIYANGYVTRLIEVLENDYPVLKDFMGEDSFYELCQWYIAQNPSTNASLRWFGRHMPAFLSATEPYNDKPYLAQLAELEWALVDAFNATDQDSIGEGEVAQVPIDKWPELSFVFHCSIQTFSYQWNILPIWQAHQEQLAMPGAQSLPEPETCLVWRRDLKTLFRTLEGDEAVLFSAAREGANFSQLCEILSDQIQDVQDAQQIPLRAAGLLKTWLSAALVTDLIY
jgi:hypothetical protein